MSWARRQGQLRSLGPAVCPCTVLARRKPIERLNRYLRNDSVIGRRLFELCAIIGAWEIEQQYEWSGHEPAALQFGVSQKAVDTIKFNRPIEGLPEDETVVIQMGRQILREHRLDSETLRTRRQAVWTARHAGAVHHHGRLCDGGDHAHHCRSPVAAQSACIVASPIATFQGTG